MAFLAGTLDAGTGSYVFATPYPAGIVAGQLIVAVFFKTIVGTTAYGLAAGTTISGFTTGQYGEYENGAAGDNVVGEYQWKIASGSESGTITWAQQGTGGTQTPASGVAMAQIFVFDVTTSSGPVNAATPEADNTGIGSNLVITTTVAGRAAVLISCCGSVSVNGGAPAQAVLGASGAGTYSKPVATSTTTLGRDGSLGIQMTQRLSGTGSVSNGGNLMPSCPHLQFGFAIDAPLTSVPRPGGKRLGMSQAVHRAGVRMQGIEREWKRNKSGILVPELVLG